MNKKYGGHYKIKHTVALCLNHEYGLGPSKNKFKEIISNITYMDEFLEIIQNTLDWNDPPPPFFKLLQIYSSLI